MRFSNVRRVAVETTGLADVNKFDINSLLLLAGTAWASLEQLEIRSLQNAPISSPLRFPNLVRLQIGRFEHRLGTPVWDLPKLEELNLDPAGGSILRSIVHAELPRLRYFAVEGETGWCYGGVRDDRNEDTVYPFLRKHGSKLVEVRISKCLPEIILSTCPNLRVYRLSEGQVSHPPFDNMTTPHASLVSLVLPQYYNYGRPREQGYITAWDALFKSLAIGRDGPTPSADCLFPSLVEVKIWGWKWPTTPQDIQHNKMVKWAEGIHSKGIRVLAHDNTSWRPRVKHGR
ncbi:hypothetical protein EXIGLDRAFT_766959 [Exidia glandulosa HHB12029]|uniref:F-box domain-containing protein n=1 Tax=Exidia glandulosa HHB12029 TaxID=1314781 RepID=A0A165JD20_EXIGL|nr:hypothetical protein EXIGLDRAFT_766959 [Exidia glandulosa HHB12029]